MAVEVEPVDHAGEVQEPVTNLQEDDLLNLEGDQYADDGTDTALEFMYATVYEPVDTTSEEGVVIVTTDLGTYSFPADHKVWMLERP